MKRKLLAIITLFLTMGTFFNINIYASYMFESTNENESIFKNEDRVKTDVKTVDYEISHLLGFIKTIMLLKNITTSYKLVGFFSLGVVLNFIIQNIE